MYMDMDMCMCMCIGGFPVIGGLVTSFDSLDKVTLAKHALSPLLVACKATGTCHTFRDIFLGDDKKYLSLDLGEGKA